MIALTDSRAGPGILCWASSSPTAGASPWAGRSEGCGSPAGPGSHGRRTLGANAAAAVQITEARKANRPSRARTPGTAFQGDAVTITATFNTLASGLNYAAYAEVTVPARQLGVKVQNFDYTRPN